MVASGELRPDRDRRDHWTAAGREPVPGRRHARRLGRDGDWPILNALVKTRRRPLVSVHHGAASDRVSIHRDGGRRRRSDEATSRLEGGSRPIRDGRDPARRPGYSERSRSRASAASSSLLEVSSGPPLPKARSARPGCVLGGGSRVNEVVDRGPDRLRVRKKHSGTGRDRARGDRERGPARPQVEHPPRPSTASHNDAVTT